MAGIQRLKVATVEITGDFYIANILQETLINKGYDIDIETENYDFHRPQQIKISVYGVKDKS